MDSCEENEPRAILLQPPKEMRLVRPDGSGEKVVRDILPGYSDVPMRGCDSRAFPHDRLVAAIAIRYGAIAADIISEFAASEENAATKLSVLARITQEIADYAI